MSIGTVAGTLAVGQQITVAPVEDLAKDILQCQVLRRGQLEHDGEKRYSASATGESGENVTCAWPGLSRNWEMPP